MGPVSPRRRAPVLMLVPMLRGCVGVAAEMPVLLRLHVAQDFRLFEVRLQMGGSNIALERRDFVQRLRKRFARHSLRSEECVEPSFFVDQTHAELASARLHPRKYLF